jgi:predicted GNAT family acetyltransferase
MKQIDYENIEVINNSQARRIEAQVGDHLAHIDYIPDKEYIIFTRTEVPEAIEHHGVAGKMVHFALEYAKSNELKVIPQCPFVAGYIHIHPKYESLVWDPRAQDSDSAAS